MNRLKVDMMEDIDPYERLKRDLAEERTLKTFGTHTHARMSKVHIIAIWCMLGIVICEGIFGAVLLLLDLPIILAGAALLTKRQWGWVAAMISVNLRYLPIIVIGIALVLIPSNPGGGSFYDMSGFPRLIGQILLIDSIPYPLLLWLLWKGRKGMVN